MKSLWKDVILVFFGTICVNVQTKLLLSIHSVRTFIKIISMLMKNNFPKWPSGAQFHNLSKLYDVPIGFVTTPSHLRQCIALFAVAEEWLLLDIG